MSGCITVLFFEYQKGGARHREEIDFLYDAGHIHMLMTSFMIRPNKPRYGWTVGWHQ